MRTKPLSPEAQGKVRAALGPDSEWEKRYPKAVDRMTEWRRAKEQIEVRVLREEAAREARAREQAERSASEWLARWTKGGGQR